MPRTTRKRSVSLMIQSSLHLTHKWRPTRFEDIVGQDLAVRMIKNGLYTGYYFPVYLFSGMHGCGKTTMARVFSAALNCHQLSQFQQQPKTTALPCLACSSCVAMREGRHPDFIEIDAASHTGVDHVRQLTENASLLPVMGNKKIYLIDEAHMLSRAAFNALLKILEEPPKNAFFMLVTTDVDKVIETVRSRCFQVLFKPLSQDSLVAHMQTICEKEQIQYERDGLIAIAREVGGAARDALHLIEQVRFGFGSVTYESVMSLLGYPPPAVLFGLFENTMTGNTEQLIVLLRCDSVATYAPVALWNGFSRLLQALIRVHYELTMHDFTAHHDELVRLLRSMPLDSLIAVTSAWYEREDLFYKSKVQRDFFEITLIALSRNRGSTVSDHGANGAGNGSQKKIQSTKATPKEHHTTVEKLTVRSETHSVAPSIPQQSSELIPQPRQETDHNRQLQQAVDALRTASESLLASLLEQAQVDSYDANSKQLVIRLPQELIFCESVLADSLPTWMPHVKRQFDGVLKVSFVFVRSASVVIMDQSVAPAAAAPLATKSARVSVTSSEKKELGVAQVPTGDKSQLLMRYFPGTIEEVM